MAEAVLSAEPETALENQRIGGLASFRVAAFMHAGADSATAMILIQVAWAVPSLIRTWHLPPANVHGPAFLWSSIGILVGGAFRRADRRSFRSPAFAAGQPRNLRVFASLLTRFGGARLACELWRFFTGNWLLGGDFGAALTGELHTASGCAQR